jgi:hypothetical protein
MPACRDMRPFGFNFGALSAGPAISVNLKN